MRTHRILIQTALFVSAALALACGGPENDESVEGIQNALELSDGGFDMDDELPAFGLGELDLQDIDVNQLQVVEEPNLETYTGVAADPGTSQTLPGTQSNPCPHGFLKGLWAPVAKGKDVGVFKGKWVTQNGKVQGWLKGIYGKNKLGHGVFFGKYIDTTGTFMGLLKGFYGNGYFKGVWHGKAGLDGALLGVYAKNTFMGKWTGFCPQCTLSCKPGFQKLPGHCFCVPSSIVPCKAGQCPAGQYCDPCPLHPACKVGAVCPAVCGYPVCKAKPLN